MPQQSNKAKIVQHYLTKVKSGFQKRTLAKQIYQEKK